jgi:F0F1-type ATP synthase epsilon subunit
MKLSIISSSKKILSADRFDRVTLMTESGEITILDHHEPLLSAIRPGEMHVAYYVWNKIHHATYITGGGVLHVHDDGCVVLADVIEDTDSLTDLQYIQSQKTEAEKIMKEYKAENGTVIDPHHLIALEYELLKYTAMHRAGVKYHSQQQNS